jgi:hypothetical protein
MSIKSLNWSLSWNKLIQTICLHYAKIKLHHASCSQNVLTTVRYTALINPFTWGFYIAPLYLQPVTILIFGIYSVLIFPADLSSFRVHCLPCCIEFEVDQLYAKFVGSLQGRWEAGICFKVGIIIFPWWTYVLDKSILKGSIFWDIKVKVWWIWTDVSKEHIAFTFRVEK